MDNEVRLILLRLGQSQIDAMFARQDDGPAIDDSDFLPLVKVVLTTVVHDVLSRISKCPKL
jgi:hypothetical protein